MPTTVTKSSLHQFLEHGGPDYNNYADFCDDVGPSEECVVDEATFTALRAADLRSIVAGSDMGSLNLGGDSLVEVANKVLAVQAAGYSIVMWYGPETQALVVGCRPEQLTVID